MGYKNGVSVYKASDNIDSSRGNGVTISTEKQEKTPKSLGSIGISKKLAEEEVGNGKVSVSAGISVDVLPVDIDISINGNEDLSVKTEIGLPGDVVSVGGGVVIDLDTGKIVGGSVSASAAGATIEVSQVECERGISISYFGISVGYSEDICNNDDNDGGGDDGGGDDGYSPTDQPFSPPPKPKPSPSPNPEDFPDSPGWIIYYCGLIKYNWYGYNRDAQCNILGGSLSSQILGGSPSGILSFEGNSDFYSRINVYTLSFKSTRFGKQLVDGLSDTSGSRSGSYLKGHLWELAQNRTRTQYSSEGNVVFNWGEVKICCRASMYFSRSFWPFRSPGSSEILWVNSLKKGIATLSYIWDGGIGTEELKECYTSEYVPSNTVTYKGAGGHVFLGAIIEGDKLKESDRPLFSNQRRPIPPTKDMNECCDASISLMRKIAKVLGVEEGRSRFPFKIPESFISIDGNEPKEIDIDDYPDAFGYLLDRIDELIGQFNIDIEIEDTDPTTKGNQTAKISIGNISEGIAEIIGLIYGLGLSQKVGTEAAVKSLISLGMVQKVITEIDAVTEEIFDHLEIPMKEVEQEIDLEFTPGVKNFDAFFKPSKERVKVPERLQGKNSPTLQDQMDVLIQAATIIKSRGFKKVDPYADIGAQVMGNLASGLIDKYVLKNSPDNPDAPPDSTKKSDFDDFIKDVEENFKDYEKPGEIDLEKSDNPKIVKLNKPEPAPKPKPPTGN